MIDTVAIKPGQSLIDLAIQERGSLENLSEFLQKNNISGLGGSLVPGQSLIKESSDLKSDLDFKRPQFLKRKVVSDKQTIRTQGQTILDIKLQETGSLTGLGAFLKNTGIRFNNLSVGQIISVKKDQVKSPLTVKYFKDNNRRLNRGDSSKELLSTNVFDSTFDTSFE